MKFTNNIVIAYRYVGQILGTSFLFLAVAWLLAWLPNQKQVAPQDTSASHSLISTDLHRQPAPGPINFYNKSIRVFPATKDKLQKSFLPTARRITQILPVSHTNEIWQYARFSFFQPTVAIRILLCCYRI